MPDKYEQLLARVEALEQKTLPFPLDTTNKRIINRDLPVVKRIVGDVYTVEINDLEHEWDFGAAGGGDVTKVGTPVDNQVGVWTGDGTIEGTANLTYDGTTQTLTITDSLATDVSVIGDVASTFYVRSTGNLDLEAVNAVTLRTDDISAADTPSGEVFIIGGDSTREADDPGGHVNIAGGNGLATDTPGSDVNILAGTGGSDTTGGYVNIFGGDGGGDDLGGEGGGSINITGGSSNNGAHDAPGGGVFISPGSGTGTSKDGDVVISGLLGTTSAGGHLIIPRCAGVPTGAADTGALILDSTNNKVYVRSGGNWVALN